MCGIAGFYSKNNPEFVSQDELKSMTSCIVHRGPDATGIYYSNNIGLGHQRLSIIDLSNDANQPMESHCMRYICVYNGEVYNFKQLADDLDMDFKTGSDTEVIVEAFAEWGVTFINKLNGMYAIAIYDKQEDILYLFRDRIGIKPIYYFWDGQNFAFASELKSLLKVNTISENKKLNYQAINEFLHLGYIPEPNSVYQNIKKFPSGHIGIVCENGLRLESYWDIEGSIRRNPIINESEAKNNLKNLIEDSVSIHLMSDVPFGTFLSGGIDSSLVTAVASKHVNTKLNTFSIGFKDSKYNEAKYAAKIAKHLDTNHHEYIVTENDAKDIIFDMLDFYDEPYADSSAIPTMMVSKLAKKSVSMVLSGDGGDELFHGYGSYKWANRLSKFHIRQLKEAIGFALKNFPSNRYNRASHLFKFKSKEKLKSHIFSQEQYFFSERELEKLLNPAVILENSLVQDYSCFVRKLTPAESQAIFDIRYYLKDDLLVKVDRASMRYALETRVPLLDYRIVEFALNLHPELKIQNKTYKYLLKEVLYDYVPREYFERPKWGFSIPLQNWLNTDLSYLINDYLNEKVIKEFSIVNYDVVEKLIKRFKSGQTYLYNRLWVLIVLHKFLIKNKSL